MGTRLERLAPLAGVLFAIVFAVGFSVSGDTPDIDASAEEVIQHYSDDTGPIFIGVMGLLLAGVLIMFFAGALRRHLAAFGSDWLAGVCLAGAAIYAAGLGQFMSSQIALLDLADKDVGDAAVALNVADNDNFGTCAVGLAVVLLAAAWHALSARSLPTWLGWVALVLGILSLAGPAGFVAFLAFPIWVLLVAITIYRATPAT
jgi:hypothetical protein